MSLENLEYSRMDELPSRRPITILEHYVIQRNLESQYGLLFELLGNGCMTSDLLKIVQSITNPVERNKKLTGYIYRTKLNRFLDGLKVSHQSHLANYIERSGVISGVEFGDWPLNDAQIKYVNSNYTAFVRNIDTRIVEDLFSKGCISEFHKRSIESKPTTHDKNAELLEIVGRRSMKDFDIFLECLQKDHSHLTGDLKDIKGTIYSFLATDGSFTEEISFICSGLVMGLGVVNKELFVVLWNQSKVKVYDSGVTTSRDISIPDMKHPQDLAGCAHYKALYITDDELNCIHRVDLTNNSVTCWTMREDYKPYGLSVTAEHNLLVTVQIRGTRGQSSGVMEYTSEGQLVREIKLDGSIQHTCRTVQLSSNQFIVCNKTGLCLINTEGQIIKSYDRGWGEGEGQLREPCSLTIDNKSRHLFVADEYNHRVLLFDFDLIYLNQFHAPRYLRHPWRLYFDSSTDRLYVGESHTGRVTIISRTV